MLLNVYTWLCTTQASLGGTVDNASLSKTRRRHGVRFHLMSPSDPTEYLYTHAASPSPVLNEYQTEQINSNSNLFDLQLAPANFFVGSTTVHHQSWPDYSSVVQLLRPIFWRSPSTLAASSFANQDFSIIFFGGFVIHWSVPRVPAVCLAADFISLLTDWSLSISLFFFFTFLFHILIGQLFTECLPFKNVQHFSIFCCWWPHLWGYVRPGRINVLKLPFSWDSIGYKSNVVKLMRNIKQCS